MESPIEIEKKILFHCGPVLLCVKSGSVIALRQNEAQVFYHIMEQWRVPWLELSVRKQQVIFLLFQTEPMNRQLFHQENRLFLSQWGYPLNKGAEQAIAFLKKRYQAYEDKKMPFPHEMGIFLDYPLEDVKLFMKNQGKNYLFCGYWKVYQDVEGAKRKFAAYDHARELCRKSDQGSL